MAEFRMPSLGADMESGVLLEWLVHQGDVVRKGDIVAVVDTQKAAIEVECFASGVVQQLLVEPGANVKVGTPLATIATDTAQEPAAAPSPPPPLPQSVPQSVPQSAASRVPATPAAAGTPSTVTSPLVRHLAERCHVDLGEIRGSGVGGRITHADVERAAAATGPTNSLRVRASPLARRLAAELGVALERV